MNILTKATVMSTFLAVAVSAMSATEVRWTGAAHDNNMSTAENWDPAIKPSSNDKAYIAVFDGVTLDLEENTDAYWCPAGIVLKNGAQVTYTGKVANNNRAKPSEATEDGQFIVDIDEGSQFTFNGTIFEGRSSLDLVKRGKGTFKATAWCGNTGSAAKVFKNLIVEEGEAYKLSRLCVSGAITVKNGARFVPSTISEGTEAVPLHPQVVVEKGGVIDGEKGTITLPSLSGEGCVTNFSASGLTVHLRAALGNLTFSGEIVGKLSVVPKDVAVDDGNYLIIGAKDTLEFAELNLTNPKYVRFASGIGTFYVKTVPAGEFFDMDGRPVVLTTARDWYVNCKLSASGDGRTPETAFRTLQEAMENAALKAGDTVYAFPGWYTNGTMATSIGSVQTNRVVVPEGVTLTSTAGAAETFIAGSPATSPVAGMDGCGTGAVRCVYLNTGAVLRGFTVTNGYTYCKSTTSGENGGGVSGGTVEDCIIVGCTGTRGGGASGSVCKRCFFKGNVGAYIGSGLNSGTAYNCVFSGHENGNYVALYSTIVNCTFLSDNSVNATWYNKDDSTVYAKNCLFLHKSVGRDQANFSHCVFTRDSTISDANIGEGSMKKDVSEMGVRSDGRPRRGSCVVGAGDNALYPSDVAGDLDFQGSQRIYNETIDIGAYEWMPSDKGMLLLFR